MLPEGWRLSCLGDACSGALQTGPFGSQLHAHEYTDHGYAVLMPKDLIHYRANIETAAKISREKSTELKRHHLMVGDILFSRRGDVARLALIDERSEGSLCGTGCLRARPSSKAFSEFLFFFLQLPTIKSWLEHNAVGQTMPNMNTEILYELPLILPPLPEQKKIAAILSTWDRAIEGLGQLLANSQQQKKALMQQLLTGKKRLPGFEGEWVWKRSKEIFKSVSIKNNPTACELLSVTQDQGVVPRSSLERRVVMPDGSVQGYKLVNPGNFIISLRSFQGGLEYSYYRGLVSPAYTVIDNKIEIENEFYKFYFKSYDFIGHLAVATIGIRDGKQISYEDFSFIKLPYPPLLEQQAIAAVLATADKEITAFESDLTRLRQEKKALMQQLLTGKRRVTVD
ncbi:restriction endonuclease subunit S [Acetobacter conturbans]|uniref:Restriction endonuclease subunit S n=1 Tax=Acetobacter conturbans TaxID=1737472 RepID=A0ABX0K4C7_9PROT|nr:restriction endonuclease subunit S [Acetobacter conturbans]NHN89470.1 restriction endonuclease subunit S [Acetobacter conturbans]